MTIGLFDTRPCAFLFAEPLLNEERGETLDEAFLAALKVADSQGLTDTRVYRGGLLLARLSYKPASIKIVPAIRRKPNGPATSRTSSLEYADRGLYAVLVGDFVETCLDQWNTLDTNNFWDYVANRTIDVTFVSSLSAGVMGSIDNSLRSHPRYIGAVSPDLGNPLHRHLFVDMMFKDAFIRHGRVFVQGGLDDTDDTLFFGADTFSPVGMEMLPYEKFEQTAPSAYLPDSLSARGLVTEMRMHRRMALNIHQKIISALGESNSFSGVNGTFEWNLHQLPDSPDEATVQAKKLTHYLLDLENKRDPSKAKFFKQRLAITREDWAFLRGQLIDGLSNVLYEDVSLDEHGVRFNAHLPVTGRNGAMATIKTGWIVRPGERASFITAIPANENTTLESRALTPSVLPDKLDGDTHWQAVHALAEQAGRTALKECVPKPLVVEGQVYMEGDCGGAYVVIKDGRKPFVRWLKKKGLGDRHYPRGYSIPAEQINQSAESAKAYADAFARVLRRNDIECDAEIYLN